MKGYTPGPLHLVATLGAYTCDLMHLKNSVRGLKYLSFSSCLIYGEY